MRINVNRMQDGIHEEWSFGGRNGINDIEENWGSEIPSIFWFKNKTEEAIVICHNPYYNAGPYKLIRFKYKERDGD